MSLRPINADEFDARTRSLPQAPAPHSDALAELARLVGHQDPFRSTAPESVVMATPEAAFASEADFAAFDARFTGGPAGDEVRVPDLPPGAAAEADRPKLRYPTISVREQRRPEPSPDAWAAQDGADEADAVPPVLVDEGARPAAGGSSRTLVVLAAVVALTAGGLGASFLARPSGAAAIASSAAAPTIMAATGPSKVQPETPAAGADAPSDPSTLLDKNNNDGTAAARVVNTVEQPVDLAQAIKPAAPEVAADSPPATSSGAFPEPRKVKTVLVRPDGSIIAQTTAPAESAAVPGTDQSSLAFDSRTSLPVMTSAAPPAAVSADAAQALPPKPSTKASHAAPKPAASTTQDASATEQARTTVATPKAKPVVHAPAKPKPAAVADATPTATTPADPTPADAAGASGGGKFSIQLGAAPSEAEGQTAATRLAAKYDLGGAKPAVVKADAGGKTVYRIRVGHLSQDEAKAMCAKVTAGGGGCFVAH